MAASSVRRCRGVISPRGPDRRDGRAPSSLGLDHECDLVDEAPAPLLARLGGPDDRMTGFARMPARVTVRRIVAAPDAAAGLAHPQVHPAVARLQTLLAAGDRRRELGDLDLVQMGAGFGAHARAADGTGCAPACAG